MANVTTQPNASSGVETSWENELRIFEVIAILHICISTYVLFAVLIYGMRTQRWTRKSSRSSLNSGPIYVVCFSAVAMTLVRVVITEVLYILPRIDNGLNLCNVMCDVANIAYASSMWLCYAFLWFLQRKIYNHACVRPMIQSWVNWLSKIYIVPHALIATGLIIRSVYINSFTSSSYGCVLRVNGNPGSHAIGTNVIISSVIVLSQFVIFILSIFPLLRVNFPAVSDTDMLASSRKFKREKFKLFLKMGCSCFSKDHEFVRTPVETATRRATTSGGCMVFFNIVNLITPFLLFPTTAPVVLRQTLYDTSSIINLISIVWTLGRTTEILFSFLPRSARFRSSTRHSCSHSYQEQGVQLNDVSESKVGS